MFRFHLDRENMEIGQVFCWKFLCEQYMSKSVWMYVPHWKLQNIPWATQLLIKLLLRGAGSFFLHTSCVEKVQLYGRYSGSSPRIIWPKPDIWAHWQGCPTEAHLIPLLSTMIHAVVISWLILCLFQNTGVKHVFSKCNASCLLCLWQWLWRRRWAWGVISTDMMKMLMELMTKLILNMTIKMEMQCGFI